MSGFTEEEQRADAARRLAEKVRLADEQRRAQAYRRAAGDPVCMICGLGFPWYDASSPDTPICQSCF